MSSSNSSSSSGIGFTGLLTIVFIVLKLLGYITWSWWWVLSPIWISIALVLIILLGMLLFAIIKG
jgi:membrane protein YdbS with pleckstrin-like domain